MQEEEELDEQEEKEKAAEGGSTICGELKPYLLQIIVTKHGKMA